ncbi:MAG: NAD(P)-dependent alcohol dehydrogenase [Chitinophagaceae bacterium]|nr:NAD(P)-dependent alcohol dehydrogenase [Chitinophagaceae bacterium]
MKAAVYTRYGQPDVLQLKEVEKPVPNENEVLVKIYAASVNSWDWDQLHGKHFIVRLIGGLLKPRYKILGADIAGKVEVAGKNVTNFRPGDEVFGDIAGNGFGGFAEYVTVPEKLLAKKSPAMSFEQAAALPQAGLLALQGLRYKGEIKQGQQILINGAGGGVGTLALQYAKMCGAEVTCVDNADKFDLLRKLGADHLIDYKKEDYTCNGRQYDKILDVIAHRRIPDYKRALKPGGVFAMIGGSMGGLLVQLMLFGPLLSRLAGKKLGLMGYKPNRNDLDNLSSLFEEGKVVPVIDKLFTLYEVAGAFRYFGTGAVKGKIVITTNYSGEQ